MGLLDILKEILRSLSREKVRFASGAKNENPASCILFFEKSLVIVCLHGVLSYWIWIQPSKKRKGESKNEGLVAEIQLLLGFI